MIPLSYFSFILYHDTVILSMVIQKNPQENFFLGDKFHLILNLVTKNIGAKRIETGFNSMCTIKQIILIKNHSHLIDD